MQCGACQHENPDGARFCNHCGAGLALACPGCEHVNPPDSAYCNVCGRALRASRPAAGPGPEPRTYTPTPLAERILNSRSAVEGERKHVSVLFCDVVDSTPMAERIGPEEMHALMDRCFQLVLAAVHRYEGTVNQFLGDGVMALFGAPLALEDAPRRAVLAALAIQETLGPLRADARDRHGIDFSMRMGIHTGPVVVGRIGDDLRMDYTAIGDTTNLAKRLEGVALPGRVLVSEATGRLVSGYFELHDLGPVDLKGKAKPVRAFEVTGERAARSRIEAQGERDLTRLVGREGELQTLTQAFESTQIGRGRVVFVVGEAGIGKSRLVHEFRKRLDGKGHTWLAGQCTSYARNTALHPIVDALRRHFGIDDRYDDENALGKIARAEHERGGELDWSLPLVRRLLSLPTGDPAVEQMDAATRRSETFRALRARVHRDADEHPLVLLIEDVHWIDLASEEFLGYLAESIPTARVLIILTHRPGYRQPYGARSFHVPLSLQPLSAGEMGQMAGAVLDVSALPDPVATLIARKAEGNPFFVEEVTRSLLEDGSLRQSNGRVELATDIDKLSIPDRIQDVLMARLDRLDEEPKRALQVASVIGREFALRLLESIHESGERVQGIVEELRGLELIYEKALHPELAFMFKHALTHDVAYESVLESRRRALHRGVGAAIEELYADRLSEHYEALAHHFTEGEEWEKAFRYHERAAAKAESVWANHAGAEHCRQALRIAERLGEAAPVDLRRELEERLGGLCFSTSRFRSSAEAYGRAADLAIEPLDRVLNLGRKAYSWFWGHEYDEVLATVEECTRVSKQYDVPEGAAYAHLVHCYCQAVVGDPKFLKPKVVEVMPAAARHPEVEAMGIFVQGEHAEWCGDFERALEDFATALEIARKEKLVQLVIPAGWFQGKALCCLGRYGEALDTLVETADLAERLGDLAQQSRILNTIGWLYNEIGAAELSVPFNERSAELGRELLELDLVTGASEVFGNASINLAGTRMGMGDWDGAAAALAPVQEELSQPGDPWMRWRYELHLRDAEARLALVRNDPEQALALTEREIEGARATGARKIEVRALELRARALLALDDRDEAAEAMRASLEAAVAIGYPPVQWRSHALGVELARRNGNRAAEADAAEALAAGIRRHAAQLPDRDLRRHLEALGERLATDPVGGYR